jgi:hypothetical protein
MSEQKINAISVNANLSSMKNARNLFAFLQRLPAHHTELHSFGLHCQCTLFRITAISECPRTPEQTPANRRQDSTSFRIQCFPHLKIYQFGEKTKIRRWVAPLSLSLQGRPGALVLSLSCSQARLTTRDWHLLQSHSVVGDSESVRISFSPSRGFEAGFDCRKHPLCARSSSSA